MKKQSLSKEKSDFLLNFCQTLADNGDMFMTSGNAESDYNFIVEVIKRQGYWSGTGLRYHFDENLNFIGTQERKFGNV